MPIKVVRMGLGLDLKCIPKAKFKGDSLVIDKYESKI